MKPQRTGLKCPKCHLPTIGIHRDKLTYLSTNFCDYIEDLDMLDDYTAEIIDINTKLIKEGRL